MAAKSHAKYLKRVREQSEKMANRKKQGSNNAQTNYVSLLFTDPKLQVLKCVECDTTLTISAFQCDESGHAACSSCSERRRAFEKVLVSVKIACQYRELGCREMMSYKDKKEHEKACKHTPLMCPLAGCDFVSSIMDIHQHFKSKHWDGAHYFEFDEPFTVELEAATSFSVLWDEKGDIFFVLHRRKDPLGSVIWLSCVSLSLLDCYDYTAAFVACGNRKLTMYSTTATIWGRVSDNDLPAEFLVVPSSALGAPGNLALEICI